MTECSYSGCHSPVGAKQLILLSPQGEKKPRRSGAYCDSHTAALARNLIPTYSGTGAPCFVIEDPS